MKKYIIKNVESDLVALLKKSGYSENTIRYYRDNVKLVVAFHEKRNQKFYDPALIEDYIASVHKMYENGKFEKSRRNGLIKAAVYIRDYAENGTINQIKKNIPDRLTPHFRGILEKLKRSVNWSESLKRNVIYAAHTYFVYLASADIYDVAETKEDIIRSYLLQKAEIMKSGSLNTIRRNLKHLHTWLYENGLISSDFSDVLSFAVPGEHRIKRPVPNDEIAVMFATIDRNTTIGKRDYAILMIAVVTGLRSADITALRFSDIDWVNGEIKLSQKKTDVPLALPLTKDVAEALMDYILNGRPNCDLEEIFLRSRIPYTTLGRRGVYSALNNIRLKAGLSKCSVHGIRRALGTNMVIAGVPLTTVAQVLGHSDISSTKQYISLDSVHLKECALSLSEL